MGTLLKLLEKLVFLAAGVVIFCLAQMTKSFATPDSSAGMETESAIFL